MYLLLTLPSDVSNIAVARLLLFLFYFFIFVEKVIKGHASDAPPTRLRLYTPTHGYSHPPSVYCLIIDSKVSML